MRVLHSLSLAGLTHLATSSPTPLNRDGPGEIKLCHKDNTCIPVSANNKCVTFPENSTKDLLWIQQDVGSTCKYYMHDKICDEADPRFVVRTYTGPENVCVGDECFGVNSVVCKESVRERGVEARSEVTTDMTLPSTTHKLNGPGEVEVCNWIQCFHISASYQCISFPQNMSYNFWRLVQAQGSVCKYYEWNKLCGGPDWTLKLNTHSGSFENACKRGENMCGKLTYVVCKDHWPGEDDGSPLEHHPQPGPPGSESTDPSTLNARTDTTKRDGPGETVICEKTWGNGRCDVLSANNACVNIPDGLAHRVGSIYQDKGVICRYFDLPCPVSSPTVALDSRRHPVGIELSEALGSKIGYVMCRDQWAAGEEGTVNPPGTALWIKDSDEGGVHNAVRTVDQDLALVKHLVNDQISTSTASPLIMCNSRDFKGLCLGASHRDYCQRAAIEVKSLVTEPGTVCTFFPEFDCQSNNGPEISVGGRITEERVADVGFYIASFKCYRMSNRRSVSVDVAATPVEAYGTTTAPVNEMFSPLVICHDVGMKGKCLSYIGPGCLPNPFNVDAIESFTMEEGYECAFYPSLNCDGVARGSPHYASSKHGPVRVDDTQWDIWSVSCYPAPYHGPNDRTIKRRAEFQASDAPGDTITCDMVDLRGCKVNANAMKRCVGFDVSRGKPASMRQARGAVCNYYTGSQCDAESIRLDSRGGQISMRDLGGSRNMFMSVECRPDPF